MKIFTVLYSREKVNSNRLRPVSIHSACLRFWGDEARAVGEEVGKREEKIPNSIDSYIQMLEELLPMVGDKLVVVAVLILSSLLVTL